ncbi:MAG TPA: glycosyltransferase [Anaerolineales bacterium]|nr:glycosyltransferase [Anaerolineales bacterium]
MFKLALYTEVFLAPSMTFIFRQLTSLPENWDAFVMTRTRANELLFPFPRIFSCGRGIKEKAINKIHRAVGGRFISLSGSCEKHFISVLEDEKPDLIHAHFGTSALEILPVAKRFGIPMISTFHGFDASFLLSNIQYTKQLKDLFAYSHIITVSKTMRDQLIRYGADPSRIQCVYIGVPVEKFKKSERTPIIEKVLAKNAIKFLQVSNFVEKKGHQYTLIAFSKLLGFYPHAKLLFAGDGPLKEKMEALATELGIRDAVEFLGHKGTEDVVELMKDADCFVHHSVTAVNGDKEGIPTVLMEAMASGLPVISTIHAGIPELIKTKANGYLVGEKDVESYVSCLFSVLKDDGTVGKNAQITVNELFNMNKQIRLLTATYNKLVNETQSD